LIVNTKAARIGVLGGTFDPIHIGHLAAASEVFAALSLDRVLVVPAAEQPFKRGAQVASGADRLAMARMAVAADPRLEVSAVDIERGAPTYTIDTMSDLDAAHPGSTWYFVTGADALARLDEWRDSVRLRQIATFVGVTRPGYDVPTGLRDVPLVEVPALGVSSTDVRRRISLGLPIRYLVPDVVADYIGEHHLYRGGAHA
jgi:nicotinate-nucleotide adenylyltransferase